MALWKNACLVYAGYGFEHTGKNKDWKFPWILTIEYWIGDGDTEDSGPGVIAGFRFWGLRWRLFCSNFKFPNINTSKMNELKIVWRAKIDGGTGGWAGMHVTQNTTKRHTPTYWESEWKIKVSTSPMTIKS